MTCDTTCKNCKCDDPLSSADLTTPLSREMNEEIIRILAERANKEKN